MWWWGDICTPAIFSWRIFGAVLIHSTLVFGQNCEIHSPYLPEIRSLILYAYDNQSWNQGGISKVLDLSTVIDLKLISTSNYCQ